MINIRLKGGAVKEIEAGQSLFDIARGISEGLARAAVAAKIDGRLFDLRSTPWRDCDVEILTFDDEDGRKAFRHTASHVLAQAVKRLWPETKLAIGPAIDNGFYYDFERDKPFVPEELELIEAEMRKIIKEELAPRRFVLERDEAIALMEKLGEPYKVELIKDLPEGEALSFYKQGEFTDLCAGPHLMNIKPVKAFKLTSIAGAYWRGDEKNKMLTRIYGTAFPKQAELEAHIERIEEAKRRDHRRLGKELGLFALMEEAPGMPFFLPKGMVIKTELINYWRELHKKAGYKEIASPLMMNKELWLRSGHWDHYKDNMYGTVIEDQDFILKPMNCPGAILVYNQNIFSYRDLPLRLAELGVVHRHEKSGTLHGLMRVRCFTQDDAHIFMTMDQVKDEIAAVINMINEVYTKFGFTYHVELSTRPENSMGRDEDWEAATGALRAALTENSLPYVVNEGDGAFYGPKIDFHLEDSIGRTWQCGTIQLDFQMPEKFDCEYIGADGGKHRPVMIHRVLFGSVERFIGVLIEHYAGQFPVWLSPTQVKVLPISDKFIDYAKSVTEKIDESGIRAEIDTSAEKIGYKIRQARGERVPYIIVVGEKEQTNGTINLRDREGEKGEQDLYDFIKTALSNMTARS